MSKNAERVNTPTEQNKEDNTLVIYRLQLVEVAINDLRDKIESRTPIIKSDLTELRDAILFRIDEKNAGLQKQIDTLYKEKANSQDLQDIKKSMYVAIAFVLTILGSVITYYLTSGVRI